MQAPLDGIRILFAWVYSILHAAVPDQAFLIVLSGIPTAQEYIPATLLKLQLDRGPRSLAETAGSPQCTVLTVTAAALLAHASAPAAVVQAGCFAPLDWQWP